MFLITIDSFIFFYFLFFSDLGLTFKLFARRIDDVVGVELSLELARCLGNKDINCFRMTKLQAFVHIPLEAQKK